MREITHVFYMSTVIFCLSFSASAQTTGNIMVGGGLDLIKSDINKFGGKVQAGLEANYFITRSFAASAGFEVWSAYNNSLMLGLRWYPVQKLFTRFRGLIGADDFGIGLGYDHTLSADWRLEGTADYYLDQGELGLRLGVAYIFRK